MESQLLNIELKKLKKITNRLFDHIIETRGEDKIQIDENLYWEIPFEKLFDMNNDPSELEVGSLADDWDFLSSLTEDESEPLARQMAYLSVLLRYISNKLGDKLASKGG